VIAAQPPEIGVPAFFGFSKRDHVVTNELIRAFSRRV
jgi:hypothetical protein